MKKQLFTYCILSSFIIFFSCTGKRTSEQAASDISKYLSLGKEISATAQGALIQNLTKAIEEGGAPYAVRFCNLKAIELIDSISAVNKCVVSRVTELNRNPGNYLSGDEDRKIWNYYKSDSPSASSSDTVTINSDNIVYYKAIKIGMPACLKCHGNPGTDIDANTLAVIDSLYPQDLARNYKTGDLRGLWKIEFSKSVLSKE